MKLTKIYLSLICLLSWGLFQISPIFAAENKDMQSAVPTDKSSKTNKPVESGLPAPREAPRKDDQMLKDKNTNIRHNGPSSIIKDEISDCEDSHSRDTTKNTPECEKSKDTMEYVK